MASRYKTSNRGRRHQQKRVKKQERKGSQWKTQLLLLPPFQKKKKGVVVLVQSRECHHGKNEFVERHKNEGRRPTLNGRGRGHKVRFRTRGGRNNKCSAARTRRVELQPWEKRQATANKERRRRLHPHSTAKAPSSPSYSSLSPSSLDWPVPPSRARTRPKHPAPPLSLSAPCLSSPLPQARSRREKAARGEGGGRSGGFCLVERPQTPPRPNHQASAFFKRAPLPRWRPNHLLSASTHFGICRTGIDTTATA